MVTIIPVEIEDSAVREILALGIAARLSAAIARAEKQLVELRAGGCVEREKWIEAFEALSEAHTSLVPVLEHARAFLDQYDEDGDAAED